MNMVSYYRRYLRQSYTQRRRKRNTNMRDEKKQISKDWGMTQVVEGWPNKSKGLSSIPQNWKKKIEEDSLEE
jgi:hypothetical protein